MKKIIALTCIFAIVFAFAACGKKTVKGGEVISNADGDIAVATKEDGNIARDSDGNIVVLATDANGKAITDSNGANMTSAVELKHAVVVGNRIETKAFSVIIPEGWEDSESYTDLRLSKKGDDTRITLMFLDGVDAETSLQKRIDVINWYKSEYPEGKYNEETKKIAGTDAKVYEAFVEGIGEDGADSYIAFYVFTRGNYFYSAFVTDEDNLMGNEEVAQILDSLEFVY